MLQLSRIRCEGDSERSAEVTCGEQEIDEGLFLVAL